MQITVAKNHIITRIPLSRSKNSGIILGVIKMKIRKTVCLAYLMIICCLLCACDPGSYSIDRAALDNVVSVELIEYKNPDQKHFATWVSNQFDKLAPFDSANATVLETLPAEKMDDFLDAFSKTDILASYYAYDSPKGICLRLNYANDNFLIIWANYAEDKHSGYIGEYSSDGTVLSFWGSFSALRDYEDLVNQYFSHSLP